MTELTPAPFPLALLPLAPLLLAALLWPLLLGLRISLWGLLAADPWRQGMNGNLSRSLLRTPSQPASRPLSQSLGQSLNWPLDRLWISAPWPALALAVLGADGSLWLEAWMLGGHWELDTQRRLLLAFTALLWALAGWYARGYLNAEQAKAAAGDRASRSRLLRFAVFWPLTLCGNLLLLVAEDIASFYLGFALMTFSAYALVIHNGSRDARIGGLAYLVMAVLGEGMILAGLLWSAGTGSALTLSGLRATLATAEMGLWMGLLLWLGFGVKAGVIGLHLWLPLAHPVAPTPASAVLSGAMIKAGLVGWMSTLPLGLTGVDESFRALGLAMLAAGLSGAFAAALLGVAQRHPKAVLAYSSVSQMGLIAVLVSIGLLHPDSWPMLSALVVFFAAHHGLSKGALFLGVGISEQPPRLPPWLLWTLLTLPALSLAGVLGSGLITKWGTKEALNAAGEKGLTFWLSLAAVGTTLLMTRTLWRQWRQWCDMSQTSPGSRPSRSPSPNAGPASNIGPKTNQSQSPNPSPSQHMPAGAETQRLLTPMLLAWLLSILAALSLPLWASWLTGETMGGFAAAHADGFAIEPADGVADGPEGKLAIPLVDGFTGGITGGFEDMRSGQFAGGLAWPPLSELPALLWPLGLGLLLSVVLGWSLRRLAPRLSRWLPAGDLWWPLTACGRSLWHLSDGLLRRLAALQAAWVAWWVARERDGLTGLDALTRAEGWLRRQLALLLLAVALALAAVLLLSTRGTLV